MMRTRFIFITIITLGSFISCKKTDVTQSSSVSTGVKTYIEELMTSAPHAIDTFNVLYDAKGRVVSLISTFSGGKFLYNYNGNTSYTLSIMKNTHLIIKETSFLNGSLLVDSTFQYNDTNDSSTTKLIYNSAGQLIQNRRYDYSLPTGPVLWKTNDYTYNTYNANGNLLTDTERDQSGNINTIATYTYTNVTTSIFSLATIYLPIMYKNLPQSISHFRPFNNSTVVISYSYTFDNLNRVTSETQSNNNVPLALKRFIYY